MEVILSLGWYCHVLPSGAKRASRNYGALRIVVGADLTVTRWGRPMTHTNNNTAISIGPLEDLVEQAGFLIFQVPSKGICT